MIINKISVYYCRQQRGKKLEANNIIIVNIDRKKMG